MFLWIGYKTIASFRPLPLQTCGAQLVSSILEAEYGRDLHVTKCSILTLKC